MTGPFTATLDLGAPFKVQSEPFALAKAVVTVAQAPVPNSGGNSKNHTMMVLTVLFAIVAGALAFTYHKRPMP